MATDRPRASCRTCSACWPTRARPSPTPSTPSRSAARRGPPSSPASTPTTTASIGNFYPYGWYGMKDRGNILPAWLQDAGYRTAHDRQVAERLRRPRRPRRGPDGLRHLARPARRLRLRLLQLRDEQGRQAAHLGRRRLRPQAGRVREHPGRRRARLARRRSSPSSTEVFGPAPLQLLGHARSARTTRPTSPAKITERLVRARAQASASRSSSGGRRPPRTARTSRRR